MTDDFAVFILTHGRADNVVTYRALRNQGYTGDIYIIIDNEDKTAVRYREIYGEQVIMFDKKRIAQTFDEGDNFNDRRAIIYARNASFGIAADLGIEYFLQLDDDYTGFAYKYNANYDYEHRNILNLDKVFKTILDYYKSIPALTIAMSQTGDHMGGKWGEFSKIIKTKRKSMNTFFCSTKRRFNFFGRINEDVNAYVTLGNRGGLFLSLMSLTIQQKTTQTNAGGMTDLYLDYGTYLKSFMSVMYNPSCVKVSSMGALHPRIHHRVAWNNAVPKIISQDNKK